MQQSVPTPEGESTELAKGALGLKEVLFCIVTGAAPLAAMQFNVPWAVGGAGTAGPATFLLATIILTIFSIGYVEMARRVTSVGGFYSFITHGFGRIVGMGAAITITLSYTIFAAANIGVTSYFANTSVKDWTNGSVDLPIPLLYAVLFVLMFALAYFHVELTAKVLGVFLVTEIIGLLLFGGGVLLHGGDHGIAISNLNPLDIQNNSDAKAGFGALAGVAFFGAFWSWVGFEMAPNYAEESRDPKKLMGSATYISVIGLGVLYTFICWMYVAGWGPGKASASIASQFGIEGFAPLPHGYGSPFYVLTDRFVGHPLTLLFELLIVTGSFACMCAFFNTASRYFYSLGREGVLPRALGRTHPAHRSPYIASLVAGVIVFAWVVGFYLYDRSVLGALLKLGTYGPVLFVFGILGIQALCSFAIIWYFWTKARDGWHWWKTGLAPLIGGGLQIPVMYLVNHYSGTLGGNVPILKYMVPIMFAVFIGGMALGWYYKVTDPARYEAIGHNMAPELDQPSPVHA